MGATATMREIELHPVVQERYPVLARGAAEVGSVQIRNLATLGGNMCNASPSADTSPSLLVLDARGADPGAEGRARRCRLRSSGLGPAARRWQPGEIVTAVQMPVPHENTRSFYYKLAVRKAMDLAMVGIAVTVVPRNGGFDQARIALGAVAPTALRATEAEALVTGRALSDESSSRRRSRRWTPPGRSAISGLRRTTGERWSARSPAAPCGSSPPDGSPEETVLTMKIPVNLTVNGTRFPLEVDPRERLLDTVRYQLDLTGAKEGCGTGDCGACTMLLDGKPVTTCLVLSATCNGREVTTVEGLAKPGDLTALQQAFVAHTALQCGVCIPGSS